MQVGLMSEGMYEVQGILGKKHKKDDIYYLIKWKGFQKKDATWEPKTRLHTIQILIDAYEQSQKQVKSTGKKVKSNKNFKKKSSKLDKDIDDAKSVYSQVSKASKASKHSHIKRYGSGNDLSREQAQDQIQKKDSNISLYQIKLNQKLREQQRTGRMRPQVVQLQNKEKASKESKDLHESQGIEKLKRQHIGEHQQDWQILKIVYLAAKNKRLFEVKVGNGLVLKELQEVKKVCPAALCTFYQKIFKIIL